MKDTIIGVDLAKRVFQVHGTSMTGHVKFRKKLTREQFRHFMSEQPACIVVFEACGSANYWAREMEVLGHEIKLIAPQYVRPFVKRQKNDAADAEAIVIAKRPIFAMSRIWDNGFRHITSSGREIRSPEDLDGFRLRVPPAPILTSLFQSLRAGPSPINFNELYTALQTRVVEGQENPLAIISTARLYEVQQSCSLTGHVWDGYWVLGNKRVFQTLPEDLQQIIMTEIDRSALNQRSDIAKLNESLRATLQSKGMNFLDVDREAFRSALSKTSFYADWRAKYGDSAWELLEQVAGKLG